MKSRGDGRHLTQARARARHFLVRWFVAFGSYCAVAVSGKELHSVLHIARWRLIQLQTLYASFSRHTHPLGEGGAPRCELLQAVGVFRGSQPCI